LDEDEHIYWQDERTHQWYTAYRGGKCDYKKCKSACCSFFTLENITKSMPNNRIKSREDYWKVTGRAQIVESNGYKFAVAVHRCAQLDEDGKCKIYKNRPIECKQWPTPRDNMHKMLGDVCSVTIKSIKRVPSSKVPKEYKG